MTLEARLMHPNIDETLEPISSHDFSAALTAWATGEKTRQEVIDFYTLDATEQTQLDEAAVQYNALSNIDKAAYHGIVESAFINYENGFIDATLMKSILGITT